MATTPISYAGTTALITGASSGLGVEFATQLARRGADLVLVARRADRLRELADQLASDHGIVATPLTRDLSDPAAPGRLRAELDERGISVQTLVNNAGFGMKSPFVDADPVRTNEMIQLNVAAVVALTHEFLPDLLRSGTGALVNVASTAAYQPCPSMAVYGATKAFVLSFTEAVAYEVRDSGLRVHCVSPGATGTEFFDVVGTTDARVGSMQTPAQVVSHTLGLLDRPNPPASSVSGRSNALAAKIAGIAPRRLVVSISGRALKADTAA